MPDPTDTDLLVDALNVDAGRRVRAARELSARLSVDRAAGKDVRSSSVKVVDQLAYADRVSALAEHIQRGELVLTPAYEGTAAQLEDAIERGLAAGLAAGAADGPAAAPVAPAEGDSATGETLDVPGLGLVDVLPDHQAGEDGSDVDVIDALAALDEESTA